MSVDSNNVATPILDVTQLTPLGQNVGTSNTTYNTWKAGTPSPTFFTVKNLTSCPQSSQCNSDSLRQAHRRRTNQMTHFWKAYVADKAERVASELMQLANVAAGLARM